MNVSNGILRLTLRDYQIILAQIDFENIIATLLSNNISIAL